MKKHTVVLGMLFAAVFLLLLGGCVMLVPSNASIGNPVTFEKDGLTITLTDAFMEQQSEVGFDAYYVSDFCGVMVLKEPFALADGLETLPLSKYIENVIHNNGHTDIKPEEKDGLWFYRRTSDARCYYSYSYKGSDAFWTVQFVCHSSDEALLKDTFYLWAQSVEVK